ncbi:hypothetical protein BU16DRAFT_559164 [Lophium mytilinum]|uniref:Uncharacterized protein n=1 Tax=Lophium mytilinum TaxID=390894 RepID=A0A6A6QY83_9PEZI|nr:hypothetical protein BU16DRAFT_559164 [Lophium mytilinum]
MPLTKPSNSRSHTFTPSNTTMHHSPPQPAPNPPPTPPIILAHLRNLDGSALTPTAPPHPLIRTSSGHLKPDPYANRHPTHRAPSSALSAPIGRTSPLSLTPPIETSTWARHYPLSATATLPPCATLTALLALLDEALASWTCGAKRGDGGSVRRRYRVLHGRALAAARLAGVCRA